MSGLREIFCFNFLNCHPNKIYDAGVSIKLSSYCTNKMIHPSKFKTLLSNFFDNFDLLVLPKLNLKSIPIQFIN